MKLFDIFKAMSHEEEIVDEVQGDVPADDVQKVSEVAGVTDEPDIPEVTETEDQPAADSGDSDVRIADPRYEELRTELAAARDEMRRRELEYFALSLLAEEKMSPKLCTMVQGETEEEISRNVEAMRTAVREEVRRLRVSSDNTPPAAGKSAVSASAIRKLSLRELKNIMG